MATDSVTPAPMHPNVKALPEIQPSSLQSALAIFRHAGQLYIGRYHVNGYFYGTQFERGTVAKARDVSEWRLLECVEVNWENDN